MLPFLWIVLATLTWALDTLIRYPLLGSISAEKIVLIEHVFLVLFFTPFVFYKSPQFYKTILKHWRGFFVIGVFGSAISTLAFTKAFYLINPSVVILLQKLQPLVVIGWSVFYIKEKLKPDFFKYAALALFGGLLISYPDLKGLFAPSSSDVNNSTIFLGYALTLLAVFGWGLSTVFGKKISLAGLSENQILTGRFSFGLVFLFLYVLFFSGNFIEGVNTDSLLKILAMVFISGILGMYLYYMGLKNTTAHVSAIAELFFPFFAVIINWIFLGKSLEPVQILGMGILLVASYRLKN
jgi:drug/metabolite transporter (DMT)-like permease